MNPPNILFIVLDAVRADHVGCYGYDRSTTPNIDSIASEGVRYTNAFSPSVWTPSVHGAIFTGKYPSHTGIYGNSLAIPSDYTTLPEHLQEAGYRTFAASAGAHIRRDRGYARGIDEYVETRRISPELGVLRKIFTDRSYAKQVQYSLTAGPDDKTRYKLDRLRRFVEKSVHANKPFFGFLNLKTAHSPFNPPRPYKRKFLEKFARPSIEVIERIWGALGRRPQSVPGFDDESIFSVSRSGGDEVMAGDTTLTPSEWEIVKSFYDGAIRYLDERLGSLVGELRDIGIFDETLFVVTSDHGDNFGDHGLTGHAFCLYDSLLHVPLVISPPETPSSGVVENPVSLLDLNPTFLSTAGIEYSAYRHATDLRPYDDRQFHDYTFAEYAGYEGTKSRLERKFPQFDTSPLERTYQAVRTDDYKLIVDSDDNIELYHWRDDPGEENDVSADHPSIVAELQAIIDRELGQLRLEESLEEPLDEDLRSQLEHLGYR